MKVRIFCPVILAFWTLNAYGGAINVSLGAADPFAVLAGSTVTNTGMTVVDGDLGVSPGTAITGFGPGIVTPPATMHSGDPVALLAQKDLATAYDLAAGEPCGNSLAGQDLGGLTLAPGVYCFASTAQLTGTLTLDAQGDPNSVFIFQIGTTLTTTANSSVLFINGGQGGSVFWQVGSSATLGTSTEFSGNILALSSIDLGTGANIPCGRALARGGAVTMDTNDVSVNTIGCLATTGGSAVPEPGTAALLSVGLLVGFVAFRRWLKIPERQMGVV